MSDEALGEAVMDAIAGCRNARKELARLERCVEDDVPDFGRTMCETVRDWKAAQVRSKDAHEALAEAIRAVAKQGQE